MLNDTTHAQIIGQNMLLMYGAHAGWVNVLQQRHSLGRQGKVGRRTHTSGNEHGRMQDNEAGLRCQHAHKDIKDTKVRGDLPYSHSQLGERKIKHSPARLALVSGRA